MTSAVHMCLPLRSHYTALQRYKPVKKELLLDVGKATGLVMDNIEGIAFGPALNDEEVSMFLVADNNFAPLQVTQFLAFAVKDKDVYASYGNTHCRGSGKGKDKHDD
jgi:Esterase-like activity of phytase